MFGELSEREAQESRARVQKLRKLLGDEPEGVATKSKRRARDRQGRVVEKPFDPAGNARAEAPKRDAIGRVINKRYQPRGRGL